MPFISEELPRFILIFNHSVNLFPIIFRLIIILMTLKMVSMRFPAVETQPAELIVTLDASHVVAPHVLFDRVWALGTWAKFGVLPNPEHVVVSFESFLVPLLCLGASGGCVGVFWAVGAKYVTAGALFVPCFSFRLKSEILSAVLFLAFDNQWASINKVLSDQLLILLQIIPL